jgi:hypothetical protein
MNSILARSLPVIALIGAVSACQGGAGEVVISDAQDITGVQVRAPSGTVTLRAFSDAQPAAHGVSGMHALRGVGAKGRTRVSINAEGLMVVEADCVPFLPCHLDLTLDIPARMPVSVDLVSGDVRTEGVDTTDVRVDRGNVEIADGITSVVRIGTGDLRAQMAAEAGLRAVVADGDVEVAVPPGGWRLTTAAAELRLSGISFDRDAVGSLDVHAPSGSLWIAGVEGLASR